MQSPYYDEQPRIHTIAAVIAFELIDQLRSDEVIEYNGQQVVEVAHIELGSYRLTLSDGSVAVVDGRTRLDTPSGQLVASRHRVAQ